MDAGCLVAEEVGVAVYAWRSIPNTIAARRNDAQERLKMYTDAPQPALPRWTVLW